MTPPKTDQPRFPSRWKEEALDLRPRGEPGGSAAEWRDALNGWAVLWSDLLLIDADELALLRDAYAKAKAPEPMRKRWRSLAGRYATLRGLPGDAKRTLPRLAGIVEAARAVLLPLIDGEEIVPPRVPSPHAAEVWRVRSSRLERLLIPRAYPPSLTASIAPFDDPMLNLMRFLQVCEERAKWFPFLRCAHCQRVFVTWRLAKYHKASCRVLASRSRDDAAKQKWAATMRAYRARQKPQKET